MAEETPGEKTFAPTPKRREDAAKKGDVLRSRELATLAATGAGALALWGLGAWLTGGLGHLARAGFRFDVPVRFAEDRLDVSGTNFAAGEAPSVPLIEIREAV